MALSVNAATGATSSQEFDPWGAVRSGSVPQTSLNYTGQRKDDTGLLYYHARYYDPALARWTSPVSIVPGAARGAGGALGTLGQDQQTELRPLTVDFHEPGLAVGLGQEDRFTQQQGFWFQLSGQDRQHAKDPSGPGNPQALNRYSYVLENPLRYKDPTGHYEYIYTWSIVDRYNPPGSYGPNETYEPRANTSPADVMRELMSNPQGYFPFKITPTNGCSVVAEGCTYTLDPGVPTYSPYEVRVTGVTATSFTFVVTTPGGFATVGSTISFSTYQSHGVVYLEQHGRTATAQNPWDYGIQVFEQAGAYFVWQDMANRLGAHYGG